MVTTVLPGLAATLAGCPLATIRGRRNNIGPSHHWSFILTSELSRQLDLWVPDKKKRRYCDPSVKCFSRTILTIKPTEIYRSHSPVPAHGRCPSWRRMSKNITHTSRFSLCRSESSERKALLNFNKSC